MQDRHNLQWGRLGTIDNQVRVDGKEGNRQFGNVFAGVAGARIARQENDTLPNYRFDPVRHFERAFFFDVFPDMKEIFCGVRRKDVPRFHRDLALSVLR